MLILHCQCVAGFPIQYLSYISAVIVAIIALLQYGKNSKIKRAEILLNLFDKFYVNSDFKKIREWLDPAGKHLIDEKRFETAKTNDTAFEAGFSDYLNYFQFLISLRNMKQLKDKEISFMFNYYLMNLKNSPFVMNYLKEYGYNALHKYLIQYKNAE